ncbi:MAG: ABC transporter ATP-binding protein [Vicinamibacterales bacterium]
MSGPALTIDAVAKTFAAPDGRQVTSIANATFRVEGGELLAVVGPSGCGKSTLLNIVAGFLPATAGRVLVDDVAVDGVRGDVGYVFQRDALLPWKTVLDNVALPLVFRRMPRADAQARAAEWIRRVGLGGFERHYPSQLSGGMRKRVALATSLVSEPGVLLLDEPFAALDVQTRLVIEHDLMDIWSRSRMTTIFVTHDLEEAIVLADRVVLMSAAPSTVTRVLTIPLGRPRHLVESKLDPAFAGLHATLWRDLAAEVRWP